MTPPTTTTTATSPNEATGATGSGLPRALGRVLLRHLPSDPLARRDPEAIRAALEVLGPLLDLWFAPEVTGMEHFPDGPCLVVGMHNGGVMAPDMFVLMVAGWRHFGVDVPSYGLAHDQVMRFPVVGRLIGALGGVPARPGHAVELLGRGARVLVYPGGDVDTFKPFRERHQVKFDGRTGFVKVALEAGVPIVPVVSVGAHETIRVLTDGRELARKMGLKRLLRVEVLPLFLCLPWGMWLGPIEGHLPMPSKLRVRVLEPVRFDLSPAEAAAAIADRSLRVELAESVRARMQAAVDEMAGEPGYGVRARLGEMARGLDGFIDSLKE